MKQEKEITVALVDDHTLFRKGMISLLESVGDHIHVTFEADNGLDLQSKLNTGNLPDIIMMDVNMPGMEDAEEAIARLNGNSLGGRSMTVNEARDRDEAKPFGSATGRRSALLDSL